MTQEPKQHQVCITGLGIHTAFGDLEQTCYHLGTGHSAVKLCSPDAVDNFGPLAGARAADYDLLPYLPDRKMRKYMNPVTELAVLAAGRALAQAGLDQDPERKGAMDLYLATGLIAFELGQLTPLHDTGTDAHGRLDLRRMGERGIRACHPLLPFKMLLNMPLGLTSIVHGIQGENHILYPGADQAALCLEKAVRAVRTGRAQRVLVGGSAHQISLLPLVSMHRSGHLARSIEQAQPDQPEHCGLAPADMSACLVLESDSSARARGARIRGTIDQVLLSYTTEELWARAGSGPAPEAVLSCGTINLEQDRLESQTMRTTWSHKHPTLERFDGRLGHGGPAALPCLLALAQGLHPGRRVLVSSADPQGQQALVSLQVQSTGDEP